MKLIIGGRRRNRQEVNDAACCFEEHLGAAVTMMIR